MILFPNNTFVLVGWVQANPSFKLPDLSLPSASSNLLIQGVTLWTSFSTPPCNILSTSCLKASCRWTGMGDKVFALVLH